MIKILADFRLVLWRWPKYLPGLYCRSWRGRIFTPAMPQNISCPSCYAKTHVLSLPLCQNTFLAFPAMHKHFSCHSSYTKTLFFPFPLRQNTFLAMLAMPIHFSWYVPYTNILYLVTPGHTWQCLVTTWQHLVTSWQHLVITWQQLVTTRQHLVTSNRQIPLFTLYTKKVPLTKVFHISTYPAQIWTMPYHIWPQPALKISGWLTQGAGRR